MHSNLLTAFAIAFAANALAAPATAPRLPKPLHEHVLVSSKAPANRDAPYLAFPAALDLGTELLISYKHGRSHGSDPSADLDLVRYNPTSGKTSAPQVIAHLGDRIMQMGEWVRFDNGDIASYIDVQRNEAPARVGMRGVRSTDGGRTFGALERVGVIDGVEYGYPFDAITKGKDTWMLVMTFSNLTGGVSTHTPARYAGSVDVIHTQDNGRTWHRVRNLTSEFGNIPINESAFIALGDGFLVTTRGYDNHERMHITDAQFHLISESDLTAKYPFIRSHVGRPRLFARDGHMYLLGRNVLTTGQPMTLCVFRLDPTALGVESYAILDNADEKNVTDGYYAVGVFRGSGADTRFHVITYKAFNKEPPSIIALEYRWEDVK
jgi:hypothetical protein